MYSVTIEGPGGTFQRSVEVTPFVIGRDPSCSLVLVDPAVAARHAQLEIQPDGRVVLRDLGSATGTFTDAGRVEATWLDLPGAFRVGSTVVRVLAEPAAAARTRTMPPVTRDPAVTPAPVMVPAPARTPAPPARDRGPMPQPLSRALLLLAISSVIGIIGGAVVFAALTIGPKDLDLEPGAATTLMVIVVALMLAAVVEIVLVLLVRRRVRAAVIPLTALAAMLAALAAWDVVTVLASDGSNIAMPALRLGANAVGAALLVRYRGWFAGR